MPVHVCLCMLACVGVCGGRCRCFCGVWFGWMACWGNMGGLGWLGGVSVWAGGQVDGSVVARPASEVEHDAFSTLTLARVSWASMLRVICTKGRLEQCFAKSNFEPGYICWDRRL
eukprot:11461840-Alexandrium_andersonii.AAC.1